MTFSFSTKMTKQQERPYIKGFLPMKVFEIKLSLNFLKKL